MLEIITFAMMTAYILGMWVGKNWERFTTE